MANAIPMEPIAQGYRFQTHNLVEPGSQLVAIEAPLATIRDLYVVDALVSIRAQRSEHSL